MARAARLCPAGRQAGRRADSRLARQLEAAPGPKHCTGVGSHALPCGRRACRCALGLTCRRRPGPPQMEMLPSSSAPGHAWGRRGERAACKRHHWVGFPRSEQHSEPLPRCRSTRCVPSNRAPCQALTFCCLAVGEPRTLCRCDQVGHCDCDLEVGLLFPKLVGPQVGALHRLDRRHRRHAQAAFAAVVQARVPLRGGGQGASNHSSRHLGSTRRACWRSCPAAAASVSRVCGRSRACQPLRVAGARWGPGAVLLAAAAHPQRVEQLLVVLGHPLGRALHEEVGLEAMHKHANAVACAARCECSSTARLGAGGLGGCTRLLAFATPAECVR